PIRPAPTRIYTLSLHDALPIFFRGLAVHEEVHEDLRPGFGEAKRDRAPDAAAAAGDQDGARRRVTHRRLPSRPRSTNAQRIAPVVLRLRERVARRPRAGGRRTR